MVENAYVPEYLIDSCLGKDYQRVANEIRDEGTEVEWTAKGPISKSGVDLNFRFLYPTMFSAERISPRKYPVQCV